MNIKKIKQRNIPTTCSPHSIHHCVTEVWLLRSEFLWDNLQRKLALSYLHFGTSYWSHLPQSISLLDSFKMEPIHCPETSVQKYQSTLWNIPEEQRSRLRCGGT